jgi:hypothetical protein
MDIKRPVKCLVNFFSILIYQISLNFGLDYAFYCVLYIACYVLIFIFWTLFRHLIIIRSGRNFLIILGFYLYYGDQTHWVIFTYPLIY